MSVVPTVSFLVIFCGGWLSSSAELVLLLILHKVTCSTWLVVVGGISDSVPKSLVFVKIGGGTSVRLRSHLLELFLVFLTRYCLIGDGFTFVLAP